MEQRSPKILLVEDQAADIVLPYRIIQHMGYDVTLSFDGEQAFNEIKSRRFDLIIMDWQMPIVGGKELLRKMETLTPNRKKPLSVVIYSGEDLAFEALQESPNFEIVDIWHKPLRANEMALKIKELNLAHFKMSA